MNSIVDTEDSIIINCFEVKGETDTVEGKGPRMHVAYFLNKPDAIAFVRSKEFSRFCCMGFIPKTDHYAEDYICDARLHIHKSPAAFKEQVRSNKIIAAKRKLSAEEFQLLQEDILSRAQRGVETKGG